MKTGHLFLLLCTMLRHEITQQLMYHYLWSFHIWHLSSAHFPLFPCFFIFFLYVLWHVVLFHSCTMWNCNECFSGQKHKNYNENHNYDKKRESYKIFGNFDENPKIFLQQSDGECVEKSLDVGFSYLGQDAAVGKGRVRLFFSLGLSERFFSHLYSFIFIQIIMVAEIWAFALSE